MSLRAMRWAGPWLALAVACAPAVRDTATATPTPAVQQTVVSPPTVSEAVPAAPPGFDDPERGEEELQDAIAADPGDLRAYEELAWLYYERSRTQPSYVLIVREVLKQAGAVQLRVGRESADLRATHGLLLVDLGRPDAGLRVLEEAVRIDPGHLRAQFAIGELSVRTRNFSRARTAFAAIVASPTGRRDVESWLSLGATESRLGDAVAAERAFDAVLRLAPDEPRVLYNLAILHMRRLKSVPEEQRLALLDQGLVYVEEFLNRTASDLRHGELRQNLLAWLAPLVLLFPEESDSGKRMVRLIGMVGDAEMIESIGTIFAARRRNLDERGTRGVVDLEEHKRLLELEAAALAEEAAASRPR